MQWQATAVAVGTIPRQFPPRRYLAKIILIIPVAITLAAIIPVAIIPGVMTNHSIRTTV